MNLKRPPRKPQGHQQHQYTAGHLARLDAVMDSHVHWRDETRAVRESYRRWQTAGRGERDDAFDRYISALDREERAADGYRRVVDCAEAY